jgi:RNA polymerase sigma-70 factor, ECF subfamily
MSMPATQGKRSTADEARALSESDPHAERALIERIRTGDARAFEELYRTYWKPLYSFAFRYLRSGDEAEEMVQDVFYRIWRLRLEWKPQGTVQDYLYLAVRNSALNRIAHEMVVHRWQERTRASLMDGCGDASRGTSRLEAAELDAAIVRALAELPAKRRAICTLRLSEGMTYREIAQRLGVAQKTVETQLARGIKFLRERLAAAEGETVS